jgi:hypothetical protein
MDMLVSRRYLFRQISAVFGTATNDTLYRFG